MEKFINKPITQKNGFTIIELMVYFSIFSIVVTILSGVMAGVVKNMGLIIGARDAGQNSRLILNKISQDIKISKSASIENYSKISLETNSSTVFYYLDQESGVIYYDDGVEVAAVSGDNVFVNDLTFERDSNRIKINLEIMSKSGNNNYILKSFSTAVPRFLLY